MGKILIIEDEAIVRHMVATALSGEHTLLEAQDGETGLILAKQNLPQLIICDVAMPEVDGFGVLEALRRHPPTAETPFIFLTAVSDRLSIRQAMALGADDYLTKPFTLTELRETVNARLRRFAEREARSQKTVDEVRQNITVALPHELRTAIMVIDGFASILLDDAHMLPPETVAIVNLLARYSRRLQFLAEKFLWYARSQVLRPGQVSGLAADHVHITVQDIATQTAQLCNREVDLRLAVYPASVNAPVEFVTRIVQELVENACKFSSPGTPIQVSTALQEHTYTLYVDNQGRGMTAEQIAQIGAFVQFERSSQEQQGVGLGLCIVKRLAELVYGSFSIQSAPSAALRASVILPLAQ